MNGRSGIKVRFDKDFEKQCYALIRLYLVLDSVDYLLMTEYSISLELRIRLNYISSYMNVQ